MAVTLRIDEKSARVKQIEAEMATPNFWQNHTTAAKATQELKHLQDFVAEFEEAESDAELLKLENEVFFTGEHDDASCFIAVHSGSGGTEAQDWAEMLL